jgi:Zn-dependent oligopeptidase
VRAASTAAKDSLKQMFDATYLRLQLYQRLAEAADVEALSDASEETRLVNYYRREFERKGSALGAEGQAALLAKMDRVEALCSQFCAALGEDNTTVSFSEGELLGLEPGFVAGLERDAAGLCLVSMKAPEMVPVQMMATLEATRQRLTTVKGQQCMQSNGPLLEQAIRLRHECVWPQKLGVFKRWCCWTGTPLNPCSVCHRSSQVRAAAGL